VSAVLRDALETVVAADVGDAEFVDTAIGTIVQGAGLRLAEKVARAPLVEVAYHFGRATGFFEAGAPGRAAREAGVQTEGAPLMTPASVPPTVVEEPAVAPPAKPAERPGADDPRVLALDEQMAAASELLDKLAEQVGSAQDTLDETVRKVAAARVNLGEFTAAIAQARGVLRATNETTRADLPRAGAFETSLPAPARGGGGDGALPGLAVEATYVRPARADAHHGDSASLALEFPPSAPERGDGGALPGVGVELVSGAMSTTG
jgi:hypothetical protein